MVDGDGTREAEVAIALGCSSEFEVIFHMNRKCDITVGNDRVRVNPRFVRPNE